MPFEIPKPINTRPKAGQYQIKDELKNAVEVAMLFNQPLLLTGEPGTGKTLLAFYVAQQLAELTKDAKPGECQFHDKPLRFNTKTSSIARDLFYTYDAVGHFQNANIVKNDEAEKKETKDFIELQAFGKAIALANPKNEYTENFNWNNNSIPKSSVVLVDEIDKAPRDFTNDILNEIEGYEFFIKEKNYQVRLNNNPEEKNAQRIVVIMTSNSEKNLPDAFLRRCVFFHIEFPKKDDSFLLDIIKGQLVGDLTETRQKNLNEVIKRFYEDVRAAAIRKKPATAEILAFVKMMEVKEILDDNEADIKQYFIDNLTLLAKTKEDIDAIRKKLLKG